MAVTLAATLLALLVAHGVTQAQPPDVFFIPGRDVNTLGPAPTGDNPALIDNPKHKQRTVSRVSAPVAPAERLRLGSEDVMFTARMRPTLADR